MFATASSCRGGDAMASGAGGKDYGGVAILRTMKITYDTVDARKKLFMCITRVMRITRNPQ